MAAMRESRGGAFESRGTFFMRVTTAPQTRTPKLLPWCKSLDDAKARANEVQTLVNRLRVAGAQDFVAGLVESSAVADAEKMAALTRFVDGVAANEIERAPETKAGPITFRKFAESWTSGDLQREYPDHVRVKKTVRDDVYRLEKLYDVIGDVPLAAFTIEDAERAMRKLPATAKSAGARRQYAQLLNKVLRYATYPAKILKASPLPSGWLPRSPNNKAKAVLYPDEEKRFLACTEIPIQWRVFFGFLARSGFRADEAAGLLVRDVDLARGIITLDENKTDDPRAPPYEAGLMGALKLWKDVHRADAGPGDLLFVRPDGSRIPIDGLAALYREELLPKAGVTRAELFARTASRIPIRAHDLRGAFVTYSLANGKTETWVMDRTGHRSSQMVNRYRRIARTAVEAGLGDLAPLVEAIPEFAAAFTAARRGSKQRKKVPSPSVSGNKSDTLGLIAQSVELRTFNTETAPSTSSDDHDSSMIATVDLDDDGPSPPPLPRPAAAALDAVEGALATALEAATREARWDVVAQIAKELEARRIARARNVVQMPDRRRRAE